MRCLRQFAKNVSKHAGGGVGEAGTGQTGHGVRIRLPVNRGHSFTYRICLRANVDGAGEGAGQYAVINI